MTNSIAEIAQTEVILVIGSNTTEQHPQIGSKIIEAVNRGAKLIVIDPRQIPLANFAALYLKPKVGTNVALLNGLAHVIIAEKLNDQDFIAKRTESYLEFADTVKKYTPEYVEEITSIP